MIDFGGVLTTMVRQLEAQLQGIVTAMIEGGYTREKAESWVLRRFGVRYTVGDDGMSITAQLYLLTNEDNVLESTSTLGGEQQ